MSSGGSYLAVEPLVSVIIVNYDGRHHLAECLRSLEQQTLPRRLWEIILVDNGSHDGSLDYVKQHFPFVRLVPLARNTGFAAGNNHGLKQARGRYIALLNNDTSADRRWLEEMLAAAEGRPDAGGVAGKILFYHDPTLLQSTGLVLYRDGRGGDRGFRQIDSGQYDESGDVFGACGAGMFLRRELLDEVGFFDERLFMYYEDLDLAWRARLHGWPFVYAPRAVIRHVHCGSSGEGSPFFCYFVERNRVLVNLKNNTPIIALLVLAGFLARAGWMWLRLLGLRTAEPMGFARAWAYLRALGSIITLLPAMLVERYRIRTVRRKVADAALTHWLTAPPARAA